MNDVKFVRIFPKIMRGGVNEYDINELKGKGYD